MRHFFLGSVIVGATPLLSNIAVATSWLSSLNVSPVLPTGNFVCTKVNSEISKVCQQPNLVLNSKGKLGIEPYMFDRITNLLIPQWEIVGQEVRIINSLGMVGSKTQSPLESNNDNLSNSPDLEQSLASLKTKSPKPNFPKFSRSSLLTSSPDRLDFAHPAPETKRVASPYGWRRRPYSGQLQFHKGIDYGAPLGSPVVAATDGIVTKVVSGCRDFRSRWCGNQFGNWVEIDHGNGAIALYGHLLHQSIVVKEGMKVWKNQEIAQVGSSGWSTGAHLDFRVKVNGKYQNPTHFVR